ncbi:MAG TPA: M23 family metallopeptidase [Microvirga sp.]|jgi:murein DD-endopeptidase MepM/ murein hydrolase activator NlpD
MSKRHSNGQSPARIDTAPLPRSAYGIDLGHEPPLSTTGADAADVDRRDVNLRWLGASVLTGITGGALIGASIYIALEGATIFAQPPERAIASLPRPAGEERTPAALRKADKLNRSAVIASAKQTFKAPMTIRVGDREVMKQRQFVRVATNLSLNAGTYATDIPPFNPLRLFAEENGERYVEPTPEVADADVSVVKRDLTLLTVEASAPALSDEDVAAILEEERRLSLEAGRRAPVPIPAQQMLSRTLRQPSGLGAALNYAAITDTPFNTIEVRVVPENVTNLAKAETRGDPLLEERDIVLKKGETLEMALRAYGSNPEQVRSITTALSAKVKVAGLPEGQRIRVLITPGPRPGDGRQIVRVVLFGERGIEGIAAVNDRGQFVSVTPPTDDTDQRVAATAEEEEDNDQGGVRLYESLYETALKNDLPRQTVDELVRIFGFDVDFQRRAAPGDTFEIFYGQDDDGGAPEVLYAALSVGGEPRRVYRYQGDDGMVDFFDEAGRSLKKFLIRKPISDGILRSGFGYRRHPVLGYSKMHTGIDWANRIGTPIVAAGNGTVIKAEWDSGYGRRIEIQHPNGYVTAYSHQSRFAAGIAPGVRVRQGQVIGYLGNSGLSTGPHLHYEVIVNGHFVDPMKIRLPRGRELDGRALAEFKRQREQVDELMQKAGSSTRLAQRTETR